ncbi:RND transporter [Solibacillus silvestris]|uniref:RND transporter n=1 Tax=Solibacillus silvestris TaxID=76853 RepID=UPI003F7D7E19
MSQEVAKKFVDRISSTVDPLANIVTISLFCENAINHLIHEKLPKVKNFKDNSTYIPMASSNYSTKLYSVYALGLIEEKLFENLWLLNYWRNKAAHNISVDIKALPMGFHIFDDVNLRIAPEMSENEIVIGIGLTTYKELHVFLHERYSIELNW